MSHSFAYFFIAVVVGVLTFGARADIPPPYRLYSIGATMEDSDPFPKISGVVRGGPADKAGIKAGDAVIAIDGTYSKSGVPYYYFAKGLSGRQGSSVELILLREGRQVLTIKLKRTMAH